MKRVLVLACALAASTAAFGQLYKWVDKDGRVTYSDQPPPSVQFKQLNLSTGQPTAPARSPLDRDKELEKGRAEAKEKSKVAADPERKAEIDRENCNRARAYLRTVEVGGRISTVDAKGEPVSYCLHLLPAPGWAFISTAPCPTLPTPVWPRRSWHR